MSIRAQTLQSSGGGHLISPEPSGGYIHAVVDVAASGAGTQVSYFIPTAGSGEWSSVIRGWVAGATTCQEF